MPYTEGKMNKAADGKKVGTVTKPEFIVEGIELEKVKKVVKKKVEDKTITITMAEGKRATATFSSGVRGHDVDVAAMRLKRMYRVYREQQRKEEEGK